MNITKEEIDFTRAVVWKYIKNNNLPPHIDKDDLLSDGYLGLLDAKEKFDPEVMPNFLGYASIRIRGAIVDGMRQREWLPRSALKEIKENSGKRAPHQKTISIDENFNMIGASTPLYIKDTLADDSDPYKDANDVFYDLIDLIEDDNDRAFMQFRYAENMTFAELGEVFGRTESCMSLWHTRIISELKEKMSDSKVDFR